jgi:F-type H+-transporting ATPase subunit a
VRKLFQGKNLIVIIGVLVALIISVLFVKVPLPTILLPAEKISGLHIGGFQITNTLIATLLADITVLVVSWLAVRNMESIPHGLQNLAEWVFEAFDGMLTDIGGKEKARAWMPAFMTVLLLLLFANWWELVPGFDSIGLIEPVEVAYAHSGVTRGYEIGSVLGISTLTKNQIILDEAQKEEIKAEFEAAEAAGEEYHPHEGSGGYVLTPFLRGAATDLNLTIGLALFIVFLSHVIGIRKFGLKYFRRFVVPAITGMKIIDFFVGILEFISEFAKVISLSFRLFGNIFAGRVLLFVMAFLVSFLLPLPFMALEMFVGFMQAFVFAILTFIYFEQATHSYAGDEHH